VTTKAESGVSAPAGTRLGRYEVAVRIAVAAIALPLTVLVGVNASSTGYVWPLVVLAALGVLIVLAQLALYRFEWFIWAVLLIRPLLDLPQIGVQNPGQESGALSMLVGGMVLVAATLWFAALSRRGECLPMGLISRALLLLTITSLISAVLAKDPIVSLSQVARTTGAVAIFIVLEQLIRSRRAAMRALVVCGLAAGIPLVGGLLTIPFLQYYPLSRLSRLTGTFVHPNVFGIYLVMLILMLYSLRWHMATRRMKRWLWVVIIVALIELVLTVSRGSWLVLIIGFFVIAVLVKEERKLFWSVPVIVTLLATAFPRIFQAIANLTDEDKVAGNPSNSASWRLDHYARLLANTDISVFGIGPKMTNSLTDSGQPPHNDYLRMLLENGVVGLACYILFIIGLLLLARHSLRYLRNGVDRGLAVGFTAVVIVFVCDSVFSNVITLFVVLIYLLALTAIVQALTWLAVGAQAAVESDAGDVAALVLSGNSGRQARNLAVERPIHGNS
jgi:O-antigen ligase